MRCYDTCCQPELDDDRYIVLSRRYPKATRCPHPCSYCGKEIPAGSPAYVVNWLAYTDRKVFAEYWHTACPEY